MIVALIAGGAGTRLWPLSTPECPKHLLNVKGDRTLLQAACDRALRMTDASKIFVVTEASHAHLVREQLSELPDSAFIVEPARRNTAGCFLAVLHHVKRHYRANESIAINWADHFVRDVSGYAESFKVAAEASQKYGLPVLVGVEPTYPAVAFGYIRKAELLEGEQLVHKVAGFKEKPQLEQAQRFFNSGEYLWNCGYLTGTLDAFVNAINTYSPQLKRDYQKLLKTKSDEEYKKAYLSLESVQLDYIFHELVKEMLVVPGIFDWMDLGSFNDLHAVSDSDVKGNAVIGKKVAVDEVSNSFIRNDEDKPLAVIGLDNVVVVNTPAGILVVRKDLAQRVRDVVKQFTD